jgi:taurine--2-oxoglutarate transaminase
MSLERNSVLHSWCVPAEWDAPTIVGGEGAYFFDAAGQRYLDMSSLAECMNLGHQHPSIVRAIQDQAQKLCFVTNAWGAEPRVTLAQLLLEKSGFEGGRVFFTLGGADANEHAVKFARLASGKGQGQVITRERSYHGASFATMALSGDSRTAAQVNPAQFGVLRVNAPYAYRCPYGTASETECAEAAVKHIERTVESVGAGVIAGVLMETNAGTNGIVAPRNYWPLLRSLTERHGIYLIADEVMSGFGRCGEWFAWQRYGEGGRPDLMTLAKGLTGAHVPLGAVVVSPVIAARLDKQMLYTGLTYCGHPLSCAAGVAAVRAYEDENLIERSRVLGQQLFRQAQELRSRHAVIGDVRGGDGLFVVIELVRDRVTREPLSPWPSVHSALRALVTEALANGVSFACRGNLLILAPPLVITESALADAMGLLDRLLGSLLRFAA